MMSSPDAEYHLARAQAETRAAERAQHDLARGAHLILAERHAVRARALGPGDEVRTSDALQPSPRSSVVLP